MEPLSQFLQPECYADEENPEQPDDQGDGPSISPPRESDEPLTDRPSSPDEENPHLSTSSRSSLLPSDSSLPKSPGDVHDAPPVSNSAATSNPEISLPATQPVRQSARIKNLPLVKYSK